ncbi:septum site-determining protein MinD [Buchnera aphidicola (Ceratoglyphina bambusae)]|uniref:septum site-determining protein MinD n=1 Tax=Buchnera aphidicola TaxID=9 RepID=UPI0031B7EBF6
MSRIVVITSGKGGVGKTTSSASIAVGLAIHGNKTVVIDFDIGLRNLDLVMGCERRVVYDFINVLNNDVSLNQALIRDKRIDNLYILPASQTRDKSALTKEGINLVFNKLSKMNFKFIICDSPAGIESGAILSIYFADDAIIITNPEVSSVRDSDRMLGIISSTSKRSEVGEKPVKEHLILTRYDQQRVNDGQMLSIKDVLDILKIPLIGVIPEDCSVLNSSNKGIPVILDKNSISGKSYKDTVNRFLGNKIPIKFYKKENNFLKWLFWR